MKFYLLTTSELVLYCVLIQKLRIYVQSKSKRQGGGLDEINNQVTEIASQATASATNL